MSTTNQPRDRAVEHVTSALRWIGDEPVNVSAPVDAQASTTYALLALADEVRALRLTLCGTADIENTGRLGDIANRIEGV